MKKSMFILTLMVAALCGCAAQQPTTLEPPETSVLVEVTPETSSGATPTATPAPTPDPTPVPTAEPTPPQPRLRNLPQLLLRLLPQPLHLCSRRRHRSKYP
jgi:hypothetical protein